MKEIKNPERHVFFCDCFSDEHQFIFTVDFDRENPYDWDECYLDPHLRTYQGFWKRLWHGLKYAFGHRSKYGAWDSITITKNDATRLRDLMQKFLDFREEKEKNRV